MLLIRFATHTHRQVDVIFLGSSTMKNDAYPLELYQNYGIAAYNLACGSQSVAESYYLAKSAIEKYEPSLVALDCKKDYDGGYHLNISGAEKLTDFLGQYLTRQYSFGDRRTEAAFDFMRADYLLFEQYKEEQRLLLKQ